MARRTPLSYERVVAAAIDVADAGGLSAVSMRNVAKKLGVEAMSLYHHVDNKQALLDAVGDAIFALIDLPSAQEPWRQAMSARAHSARRVLGAHPWALHLVDSSVSPGANVLAHHNAVLACLRASGFSLALAAHAISALDSYIYGFVLVEQNLPFNDGATAEELAADLYESLDPYPALKEFTAEHIAGGDYAYADEFDYGLDLLLDGLQRHLTTQRHLETDGD